MTTALRAYQLRDDHARPPSQPGRASRRRSRQASLGGKQKRRVCWSECRSDRVPAVSATLLLLSKRSGVPRRADEMAAAPREGKSRRRRRLQRCCKRSGRSGSERPWTRGRCRSGRQPAAHRFWRLRRSLRHAKRQSAVRKVRRRVMVHLHIHLDVRASCNERPRANRSARAFAQKEASGSRPATCLRRPRLTGIRRR